MQDKLSAMKTAVDSFNRLNIDAITKLEELEDIQSQTITKYH